MTDANPDLGTAITEFTAIIRRLRAPGGCPWDAKQTPETLRTYVLEEAYELIEALADMEVDVDGHRGEKVKVFVEY